MQGGVREGEKAKDREMRVEVVTVVAMSVFHEWKAL